MDNRNKTLEYLCTAGILLILLALLAACGGEKVQSRPELACVDQLASCEFIASRTSGDTLSFVLKAWDCAEQHGACVAQEGGDCEAQCDLTRQKQYCMEECAHEGGTTE